MVEVTERRPQPSNPNNADPVSSPEDQHKSAAEADVEAKAATDDVVPDQPTDALPIHNDDRPYTLYTESEKIAIIITASFLALASPIATSTYLPAINELADDLNVSVTLINLTITTYMVR
jgi:hypothetical protein